MPNEVAEWKARVLADRGRAIEQVKRLYAVVMGFAVWSCITDAYRYARLLLDSSYKEWNAYSILAAQALACISLIALFYLGAERMLDRRYLQHDSPVASRFGFWFDLFTLGSIALWFAILANTFPTAQPSVDEVYSYFRLFLLFLLILYVLDIGLLVVHGAMLLRDRTRHTGLLKAYTIWILSNLASIVAIGCVYKFVPIKATEPYLGLNCAALIVSLWHIARFFWDFLLTFKFYFPPEDINDPPAHLIATPTTVTAPTAAEAARA
jgi:hypothetical protein